MNDKEIINNWQQTYSVVFNVQRVNTPFRQKSLTNGYDGELVNIITEVLQNKCKERYYCHIFLTTSTSG